MSVRLSVCTCALVQCVHVCASLDDLGDTCEDLKPLCFGDGLLDSRHFPHGLERRGTLGPVHSVAIIRTTSSTFVNESRIQKREVGVAGCTAD